MSQKKLESLQRVLDFAGKSFVEHRLEDISVADIARAAHCSTATIYEFYGSKEKLFIAAMSARLQASALLPPPSSSGSALVRLLDFVRARIEALADPNLIAVFRAISRQPELTRRVMASVMQSNRAGTEAALYAKVDDALAVQALRPIPRSTIVFNIIAASAYETALLGVIEGPRHHVSIRSTLAHIFTPLVTDSAHAMLRDYLDTIEPDLPSIDQTL